MQNRLICVALFFLASLVLQAAELTIDHVTVAGVDLKAMQAHLAKLGIQAEYGGAHTNRATQMALASFQDGSYLELIALQENPDPTAVAAHYWSAQIQGNAGPAGWAVRTADITGEVERLKSVGVDARTPVRSGRLRPDGTRLEWESARVGPEPNGTYFPFLIRDLTPRVARAFPAGQASNRTFPGVRRVVIAVHDLKAAELRFRTAYGLPPAEEQTDKVFGARVAWFKGTPVVLAVPLQPNSWIAKRLERFGEGPCAFVLGKPSRGDRFGVSRAKWFGQRISWFDAKQLGWYLGFEN